MLQRVSTAALLLALCLGAGAQTDPDADMRKAIDAIKAGKIEELKSLLRSRPELAWEVDRQYGATLLHWAAVQKNLAAVSLLIDEHEAYLAATNDQGATPLQVAIVPTPGKPGGPDLLKLVERLSTPEVVKIANVDGKTALHLAFQYNQIEVARFLINEMKADLNALTKTGKKPLDYAPEAKKSEIARLLKADRERLNPPPRQPAPPPPAADTSETLRAAARDGKLEEVRHVLQKHPGWIDSTNEHKETPLHIAAKNCQLEVVSELIKSGADLGREDDKGRRFCDLLCRPPAKQAGPSPR